MIRDYHLKYLLTTFIFCVKEEGVAIGEKKPRFSSPFLPMVRRLPSIQHRT